MSQGRLTLRGRERDTWELSGLLPLAPARRLLPRGLEPEREGDRALVSLLAFAMTDLRPAALPVPGLRYGEALWRIGVRWRERPAWFGVCCDLDTWLIRGLGRALVRYPVRRAHLRFDAERLTIRADDRALVVRATAATPAPPPGPPRPLLVARGADLFEVPWAEDPPAAQQHVALEVEDDGLSEATLGPVLWSAGSRHRGRLHRCGVSVRLTDSP